VAIIGASERHAEKALSRLKSELEHSPLLLEDFPKTVYPLARLESQSRRCVGQLMEGVRTEVVWQRKELILPTAGPPDNEASGGIVAVAGITGAIRGLSHVDASGRTIRPSLVLADDPQDRESSRSVVQTDERMQILTGDLMGLAGPGGAMTCIVPCTVINRGDLADQLLDHDRHPEFNGIKYKMVYEWPTRMDLWGEFLSLQKSDPVAAREYYRARRAEMDLGARLGWESRFGPGELSALHHAFALRAKLGEHSFEAEMQNEPVVPAQELAKLDPVLIARRTNGVPRFVAPGDTELITAMIDVGQEVLWFMVCGWAEDFSCAVLDYGGFPEQPTRAFLARNASPSLGMIYPGGVSASVYSGLRALLDRLLAREWRRTDGATLRLARILVDRGWENETVVRCIGHHPGRDMITPAKGEGFGPQRLPIAEYHKRPGEKLGPGWVLNAADRTTRLRYLRFDSHIIKNTVADMLVRPMGERGGITLYGDSPLEHELLAHHLCSETPVATTAMGRTVNCWTRLPNKENHLLDTLCGCVTAASLEGFSPLNALAGKPVERQKKPRASFAEWQQRARRGIP
jgi:hypothetical protein